MISRRGLRIASGILAGTLLGAGSPAQAFKVTTTSGGKAIKWATPKAKIRLNTRGGPAGAVAAVDKALFTWTQVRTTAFAFSYGGTTSSRAFGINDGVNLVDFGAIASRDTLAMNKFWYTVSTGRLLDSDVRFNTNYPWSTTGDLGSYDVWNIGVHEFGHSLSLADLYSSGDAAKSMYGYGSPGETASRTLDPDDIAGIHYLYPGKKCTPTAFQFKDKLCAAPGAKVTSNAIRMSGCSSATIAVEGGTYSINGGSFKSLSGKVSSGDVVRVRVQAPMTYETTTSATLMIGGRSAVFSVTTADVTPAPFSFTALTRVKINTLITSDAIQVAGICASSPVSVAGGEYSINGGPYTSAPGHVSNGATVNVRVLSSESELTTTVATLTVGGVSAAFIVTTDSRNIIQTP